MGTTADAIAAGSTSTAWVVAIEGYGRLLTDWHTPADVVTAFDGLSGGDYTDALGGLFVDLRCDQSISPWAPFGRGGSCTLTVVDTGSDTFGIDANRRGSGVTTELTETASRSTTTLKVQSTAGLPSSGTVYIGTEAIAYTSVTSTPPRLNGCTRGKFSPFGVTKGGRFAQHHRVGAGADQVVLAPVVSTQPRRWHGRLVGVWLVRISGGALDTFEEAQLVFAGRIDDIRDSETTTATVVNLKPLLDGVGDTALGRNLFTAKAKDGIHLKQGMKFDLRESSSTSGVKDATTLEVKDTPTLSTHIATGYYTVSALLGALNSWMAAETADASLTGSYELSIANTEAGWRTTFTQDLAGTTIAYFFTMPQQVGTFLGFTQATVIAGTARVQLRDIDLTNPGSQSVTGTGPLLRSVLFKQLDGVDGLHFELEQLTGDAFDQFASLPSAMRPPSNTDTLLGTLRWGVFVFDDAVLMRGAWLDADGTAPTQLVRCRGEDKLFSFKGDLESYSVPYDGTEGASINVRQVLVFESTEADVLKSLMYSTGTSGYNDAAYDSLPFGCGVGIPGSLLADEFENSVDALPGADGSLTVVIDKPTSVRDLLEGDLVLRLAFLVWRDQHIRFGTWRTPTSEGSPVQLSESNKAEPAGNITQQRSATTEGSAWLRSIVKVQYNRDFSDLSNDGFRDVIALEDKVAVDDAGGEGSLITVRARNTFGQFEATGAAVESLLPRFWATITLFTRPARLVRRSIDSRYFQQLAPGDVVLVDDSFARDPATGTRGLSARPALVVAHTWSWGGLTGAGQRQPSPQGGEVTLFMTDASATLSDALYAPGAAVDHTYASPGYTAGYNSTTKTLRCVTRQYNQSTSITINGSPVLLEEPADATYFPTGAAVRIIERDPADINAPQNWEDTVASQSGDDITLTTGLAGFDTAKRYLVIANDYDVATTTQKLRAYQADDADGMILNSSAPYLYRSSGAERTWTVNDSPPAIEMLPALAYADGAGRDVAYETALTLLLDNVVDYKTGISLPVLFAERSNTANAGAWELVYLSPIWLSRELLSNAVTRELSVSIHHRSTDGTSATVRISLCKTRPTDTSRLNVSRGTVYAEMERSTTSTSYVASTVSTLDASIKGDRPVVWLLVECGYKAATRGLSRLQEGPRTQPQAWVLP